MEFETEARDCLYINWALPREAAPAKLPKPLRYEIHRLGDQEMVFFSVLLFRLSDLHATVWPWARISYPQANLRFYVFDGEDRPAVYFLRTWVPWWVFPLARGLAHQPAQPARLRFPRPSGDRHAECWRWRLWCGARLALSAALASPQLGPGPILGSWERAVEHFRQRRRGYVRAGDGVHLVRAARPMATVWPLRVEIENSGLLEQVLPAMPPQRWYQPHSAWLSPQIPLRFTLGPAADKALARAQMPAAEGA